MTAVNHALTGALIGCAVTNPLLALPLAVLSHFVCDALPHYDGAGDRTEAEYLASKQFRITLGIDAALCVLLVAVLAVAQPNKWWLIALSAFFAASPDLLSLRKYRRAREGTFSQWRPSAFTRFAKDIQWFERPIGAVVEVAWFIGASTLLVAYL